MLLVFPDCLVTDGGKRTKRAAAVALLAFVTFFATAALTGLLAQEAPSSEPGAAQERTENFGQLFDAVVDRVGKSFWDKERLASIGWERRAADVRQSVVEAPSREEAARRINALLGELKTSHTGLLTPDDVEYYILLDVFSRSRGVKKQLIGERFRTGVRYAGIGIFSVRIDGRDYVDAVLEGYPAERAGIKAGDEIVNVDGGPFHPIRTFRGRIGQEANVTIQRTRDGPTETVGADIVRIAPLRAFNEATLTSARVIEREGRRIGYVHVWASYGDQSLEALKDALAKLNIKGGVAAASTEGGREEPKGTAGAPPLDALVIDMRGKIGGTGGNAGHYLDLIDPRGPRIRSRNKREGAQASVSLRRRTALLIDRHTRSTAELFVHAYKRERQGPLIGSRTAGAVSAAAAFAMPGGNLLYLAVTGLEVDGEVVEGPGVSPDVEVERPIPYANGADPVLEAAIDYFVRGPGQAGRAAEPAARTNSP
jgi:carboxyl-terminal processing protease